MQRRAVAQDYLVPKLATGTLSNPEESKLNGAIDDLRLDLSEVEADVTTIKRARALEAAAAGLPTAEVEARTAADAEVIAAKTAAEAWERMQFEAAQLADVRSRATDRVQQLRATVAELGKLKRERADLFGGPTETEFERRMHLVQSAYSRPSSTLFDVREFEQVMADPKHFQPDRDYIPVDGQSETELADLIARATAMHADLKAGKTFRGRYLAPTADAGKFANASAVVWSDSPEVDPAFDPEKVSWQTLPGQTEEQLSALVDEFSARVKKAQRANDTSHRGVVYRIAL